MDRFEVDANILVEILVNSQKRPLSNHLKKVLLMLSQGKLEFEVEQLVIHETLYVLDKHYGFTREERADAIWKFLNVKGVEASDIVRNAVKVYKATNLDFADIFLAEKSKSKGTKVLTWDKGFKKMDAEYYTPKQVTISEEATLF